MDVSKAKVFMVGAGGIGCELLKNLVMSGFQDIELIDLDTIDISNLNRQFLFHKQHVGQSKAKVAREAALAMRPSARIVAHHGNVTAPEFDVDFFSKFTVVLNALDNLAARRHVNRLCLAAGVPLIDSGTAGFLGQVTVHIKGVTECYECENKPPPKGFPTCTITNTPSKPVHCIVWAKELPFLKLFGDKSVASDLDTIPAMAPSAPDTTGAGAGAAPSSATAPSAPDSISNGVPSAQDGISSGVPSADGVSGREGAPGAAEPAAGQQKSTDFFSPTEGESIERFARRVFDRLFGHNVAETLKMDDMWRTRTRPTPHYLAAILPSSGSSLLPSFDSPDPQNKLTNGKEPATTAASSGCTRSDGGGGGGEANGTHATVEESGSHAMEGGSESATANLGLNDDHAVWSLEDNTRLFLECIRIFFQKRQKDIGSLTFDKDDDLAVQFVVAASNIRAHSFGIPMQSLFAVKGIAGSIIHAVATTNAIVAGAAVLQTLKLLRGMKEPKTFWCHRHKRTSGGQLLYTSEAEAPFPKCHACSQTPLLLELNTETATLGSVISAIIKQQLGAAYPTVTSGDALLYEEGADLDPEEVAVYAGNAKKKLSEFGSPVRHGSVLTVEDYQQHFKCDIHIKHRSDVNEEEHPSGMILHGALDIKASDAATVEEPAEGNEGRVTAAAGDDDDIQEIHASSGTMPAAVGGGGSKRKEARKEDDDDISVIDAIAFTAPPSKRKREVDAADKERGGKRSTGNVVVLGDE